jgi:hypothetical protein
MSLHFSITRKISNQLPHYTKHFGFFFKVKKPRFAFLQIGAFYQSSTFNHDSKTASVLQLCDPTLLPSKVVAHRTLVERFLTVQLLL